MLFDTFKYDMKELYDEKLVSELFTSKKITLCNVADSFYAAFPHAKVSGVQCGVIVSPEIMKMIYNDPSSFSKFFNQLSNEDKEKYVFALTDDTKEVLRDMKRETELNGPVADIDVEFEQQLGVRDLNIGRSR